MNEADVEFDKLVEQAWGGAWFRFAVDGLQLPEIALLVGTETSLLTTLLSEAATAAAAQFRLARAGGIVIPTTAVHSAYAGAGLRVVSESNLVKLSDRPTFDSWLTMHGIPVPRSGMEAKALLAQAKFRAVRKATSEDNDG